jgi:hypothetical protein
MEKLPDYEVLGKFYLGKEYDLAKRELGSRRIDYDARDLTTHALCVGMTGSGKTGLCVSLLEEAAIDGIPAICIDPKGDLGNLLLTFPHLKPNDFLPYLEQGEATKQGLTIEELATQTAERWEKGLASWDQNGARIQRLRDAVDMQIYTPGSSIGTPLTALKSFDAPPQEVLDDDDAFREMVSSAASGILALLGIDADPLSSREHILLATIFDRAWRSGRDLDLAEPQESIGSACWTWNRSCREIRGPSWPIHSTTCWPHPLSPDGCRASRLIFKGCSIHLVESLASAFFPSRI